MTKRGISWKKWEKISENKSWDGIGFRDLESFNRAMLTKQFWRLLQAPNSLVSKILQKKYFKHRPLIEAKLG